MIPDLSTDRAPGSARTPQLGDHVSPAQSRYYGLLRAGLSPEQAGNILARVDGLGPVRGGWSVSEIERLKFIRWLAQIAPDRATTTVVG